MKIVFMGTPDFAVPALRILHERQVLAVFCQPDRPRGRSKQPRPCPVKETALGLGFPVWQPKRIRAKKWVALLRELAPDVIVVAAYGQILSRAILDIPTIDSVNIHASLLPRWRGASPIHHALLHGDRETGVAIMRMVRELDAGPVYSVKKTPIEPGMSRSSLEEQLSREGAKLLAEILPNLAGLEPEPQSAADVTYAPIIQKQFGYIDFAHQNAFEIERMTRAYEDWPGVYARFRQSPIKLIKAHPEQRGHAETPGAILEVSKKRLVIACCDSSALILELLQPAGKKPQPAAAFINGYRPRSGERFESHG